MELGKRQIREKILEMRNSLTANDIEYYSEVIASSVLKLPEYKLSSLLFCYLDCRSEVHTDGLIERFKRDGKRIAVPLVEKNKGKGIMTACEITGPENELVPGSYGIREPDPLSAKRVSPREIDMAIVPGAVFDEKGNRIGYGAGYYDRFLGAQGLKCIKIGIAFDLQVIKYIQAGRYDIPMDMIITEKRVLRFGNAAKDPAASPRA